MIIRIKEIEIDMEWWEIALLIAVVIIVIKIKPKKALKLVERSIKKWLK